MKGSLSATGSTSITNLLVSDGEMRETRQSRARRSRGSIMVHSLLACRHRPWHGSCCRTLSGGRMANDSSPVMLGPNERNTWNVSNVHADLVRSPRQAMPALLKAEPKDCTIDLARTAMIVIDMQNDFCHREG